MVLPSPEIRNQDSFRSFEAEQWSELYVSVERNNEDIPNKKETQQFNSLIENMSTECI